MDLAGGADDPTLPVRVRFTPGSIVRAVVIVMAFVVVAQVVGAASEPLIWFAEGVTGAAIFYPIVLALSRKMPHWVAVAVVSLALVLFVGMVGLRLFTELKGEAEEFQQQAPTIAQNVESSSEAARQFGLGEKVGHFANDVSGAFNFEGASVATLSTAASIGSALFIVWLFGIMMLFSAPSFIEGAGRQFRSEDRKDRSASVLRDSYRNAWSYAAFTAARCLGFGFATWVLGWLTGLQAPTLLAVWVAVWAFVPGVGLVIGGVLVAIVAMFSSFTLAGGLFVAFIVVQVLDSHLIQRRIEQKTVHVGPAITFVAAVIGFGLAGFGGTVLACMWTFFALAVLDQLRPDPVEPAPPRGWVFARRPWDPEPAMAAPAET